VEWFKQITNYHHEWIAIMKSFGAKDHAEDIVQEVYIRLLDRADKEKLFNDGKLNKAFIYFALRNTWIYIKRKQRSNRENKNRIELVYFKQYKNDPKYKEDIFLSMESEELNQKQKHNKYEIILNKINEEIDSWHWYDSMLFKEYVSSGKSIRTLAKETKISRDSIFQTLKNCKTRIKNVIGEDWEDFRNKDYHLIKAE
jgi:RNA polymerase sigma factor (sigma-70 family)